MTAQDCKGLPSRPFGLLFEHAADDLAGGEVLSVITILETLWMPEDSLGRTVPPGRKPR